MKWAVEIQNSSLERRNLADLLAGLGFELVDGVEYDAFTSSSFTLLETTEQAWSEVKKLREAMTSPADIDPGFTLGAVVDCSTAEPKRHHFLEVQSTTSISISSTATLTVSPPQGLSEEELIAWEKARAEQEYQAKLESQRSKLEPAYREPRAAKMLELLQRVNQTGETLYKIYELAEGHPSNRIEFHNRFGVSKDEFDRFRDAVHNPGVSGDLARHAYEDSPRTTTPMTIRDAETFVRQLAKKWLASVRSTPSEP